MGYDHMEGLVFLSGMLMGFAAIYLSVALLVLIICPWRIFKKAGKPGWIALIPIYRIKVLFEMVGLPGWYILLLLVPGVSICIIILFFIKLAHSFGKSTAFGVACTFFGVILIPIIAFDKSKYILNTDNDDSIGKSSIQFNNQNQFNNINNGTNNVNDSSQVMNIGAGIISNSNSMESNVNSSLNTNSVSANNEESTINNNSNMANSQTNTSNNVKFCPSCGNKLDSNANNCFMCGHKF